MPDPVSEPAISLEARRVQLEYDRLKFERQKLAIESRLKRQELRAPKKTIKELFSNPLSLALTGGFVTLLTSVGTASYTARENRLSEDLRAKQTLQAELIKKFVEAPTSEKVRSNLEFLVSAKLIPDFDGGIRDYLRDHPDSAPSIGTTLNIAITPKFETEAAFIIKQLVTDFDLKDFQAAGVAGNIGYETAGLQIMQEPSPMAGRGGLGYLMWTGPRRMALEQFARSRNLDASSREANYSFLRQELQTSYRGVIETLKSTNSLREATHAFVYQYVRPANPKIDERLVWAQVALNIFQKANSETHR